MQKADLIIVGGGPAGAALACLAASASMRVICLDQGPSKPAPDPGLRHTAISRASRSLLQEVGIWQNLSAPPCFIDDIRVLDGDSPVLLRLKSGESGGGPFGWNVANDDLRRAAMTTMRARKNIRYMTQAKAAGFEIKEREAKVFLEDGRVFGAALIVGADGKSSFTRDWMDVGVQAWPYHQTAILCAVAHEHPHRNKAVEHFWPGGPFAVLPMNDTENGVHRSGVVFTEDTRPGKARESLISLSEEAFESRLNALCLPDYGRIKVITKRFSYPLGFSHAARYTAPRMALVADAAHSIHPIAGQSLNLGFQDVKDLSETIKDAFLKKRDIGAPDLLAFYDRRRHAQNITTIAAIDALVRISSRDGVAVTALRRAGIRLLARAPLLRQAILRH